LLLLSWLRGATPSARLSGFAQRPCHSLGSMARHGQLAAVRAVSRVGVLSAMNALAHALPRAVSWEVQVAA